MILPGRSLIPHKIIRGALSAHLQSQPCGVDLTLKRILTWTSAGTVDFDNSRRRTASTEEVPSPRTTTTTTPPTPPPPSEVERSSKGEMIHLPAGAYLVEFNETVSVPLDAMGQLFVRSSLFRSGALLSAGVVDSGYAGAVGALLQVVNPLGLQLGRDARLAQLVLHRMSEPVRGYDGAYQGSEAIGE